MRNQSLNEVSKIVLQVFTKQAQLPNSQSKLILRLNKLLTYCYIGTMMSTSIRTRLHQIFRQTNECGRKSFHKNIYVPEGFYLYKNLNPLERIICGSLNGALTNKLALRIFIKSTGQQADHFQCLRVDQQVLPPLL